MRALEDPLLGGTGTGGKISDAHFNPEDDKALMRLMNLIDQAGKQSLRDHLLDISDKPGQDVKKS